VRDFKEMSLEALWALFPILLRAHDPRWADWYAQAQSELTRTLAPHGLSRISHIGSTAVPGLLAKPTVDILAELTPDYDPDSVARLLENSGWLVMARDGAERTLDLNRGYTPQGFAERVYHLHIRPPGDWGELYFRDYLRERPATAREYEHLKLGLREKFERDRGAYTAAKGDFVQKYTQAARDEFGGRYSPAV
jgi:GrpB-like predicted nucleotidyltransferase (UPF0157 family)